MQRDSEIEEKINRYVHDLMSEEEKISFEIEMASNKSLKSDVELLVDFKKHFNYRQPWEYKKKVQQLINEENSRIKVFKLNQPRLFLIGIAASIILIIGYFSFFKQGENWQQLAMNTARNDFSSTRGINDELNSFKTKDYQIYIERFISLLNDSLSHEKQVQLTVNIARSYILLKNAPKAIKIIENSPEKIKTECSVQYVLAIAYIYLEQNKVARDLLDKITIDRCSQKRYAKMLLEKI